MPARSATTPAPDPHPPPAVCLALQAEADPAALEASRVYLAKLRDTLLTPAGILAANVTLAPLPSNTATCEPVLPAGAAASRLLARLWPVQVEAQY